MSPSFRLAISHRLLPLVLAAAVAVVPGTAAGDSPGEVPVAVAPATGAASVRPEGLAVVAFPGATDSAWPLAQAVYAEPSLRPTGLDEDLARVMCGEPASSGAKGPIADIAATVAALRGDDPPSRTLLVEIARRAAVRALVTVRLLDGHPVARVFLPETGGFDAATFTPDAASQGAWSAAAKSIARLYGHSAPAPAPVPGGHAGPAAPSLATHEAPQMPNSSHAVPFYESPWFWGALGAAVLVGGGVYLATRDTSPSTIHLELKVP
jgi:hypothetical protein